MPHIDPLFPILGRLAQSAHQLVEWLITYAIHSTLLIGGLLLVASTALGRRYIASSGSWVWRFALVGAMATASLQSIRTTSPLAGTLRLDRDTPARTMVRVEVSRSHVTPGHEAATTRKASVKSWINVTPVWPLLVLGTWLLVAAAMTCWFFISKARFLRSIGPRRSADHTLAGNALRHLLREGRISRPVRLTMSDRLTSPVALGNDEICLPSRAMSELGPVRMESILAHELAHLVRRDPMWLTASRIIEALFFFQPLNVIARRRMQESAEFASDAWASMRVARPLDLAHCLARVAEWTIAAPRLPVPAMAERRGPVLVRRVERLTTGRVVPETTPSRALRLTGVLAMAGLVLMAPRAAIGADRSKVEFFNTQVPPGADGVVMFRRSDVPPIEGAKEKQVEAVLVRIQGR